MPGSVAQQILQLLQTKDCWTARKVSIAWARTVRQAACFTVVITVDKTELLPSTRLLFERQYAQRLPNVKFVLKLRKPVQLAELKSLSHQLSIKVFYVLLLPSHYWLIVHSFEASFGPAEQAWHSCQPGTGPAYAGEMGLCASSFICSRNSLYADTTAPQPRHCHPHQPVAVQAQEHCTVPRHDTALGPLPEQHQSLQCHDSTDRMLPADVAALLSFLTSTHDSSPKLQHRTHNFVHLRSKSDAP